MLKVIYFTQNYYLITNTTFHCLSFLPFLLSNILPNLHRPLLYQRSRCHYLAMPRLENPAGTIRTSRRGKGWTPRTVWAAAKHLGNSLRMVCKGKQQVSQNNWWLYKVLLEWDICILTQKIHTGFSVHVFAFAHVCAPAYKTSRSIKSKAFTALTVCYKRERSL